MNGHGCDSYKPHPRDKYRHFLFDAEGLVAGWKTGQTTNHESLALFFIDPGEGFLFIIKGFKIDR